MEKTNRKILSAVLLILAALIFSVTYAGTAQAATAKWVKSGSKWKYRQNNGKYAKKKFLKIKSKYYYFPKSGKVKQGWFSVDGYKYYGTKSTVKGKSGQLKGGWVNTVSGKTYYFLKTKSAGKYGRMVTGWQKIGSKVFYFGEDGVLATGWQEIGGKTYYLRPTGKKGVKGSVYTGWMNEGDDRIYFETSGSPGTIGAQYKNQWGPKGGSTRVHFDASGKIDRESMTKKEFVEYIGKAAHQDYINTGILASVTAAQAILESGYGMSVLSLEANNIFGIKISSSGVGWTGSTWDGESKYGIMTGEYLDGKDVMIYDYFRQYKNWEESIADHSAYLTYKTYGSSSKLRYSGVVGCTDYMKAFRIIQKGGYATDPDYAEYLGKVVKYWDLTKYDKLTKAEKKLMKANVAARQ